MSAIDQASAIYQKASTEWGGFRLYLAAHPLRCFWIAIVGGLIVGRLSMLVTRWPF